MAKGTDAGQPSETGDGREEQVKALTSQSVRRDVAQHVLSRNEQLWWFSPCFTWLFTAQGFYTLFAAVREFHHSMISLFLFFFCVTTSPPNTKHSILFFFKKEKKVRNLLLCLQSQALCSGHSSTKNCLLGAFLTSVWGSTLSETWFSFHPDKPWWNSISCSNIHNWSGIWKADSVGLALAK